MIKYLTWPERIRLAEKRGRFTEKEISLATADWKTCAVGEQVKDLYCLHSSWSDGITGMVRLGMEFGHAVFNQKFAVALKLYREIGEKVQKADSLKRRSP